MCEDFTKRNSSTRKEDNPVTESDMAARLVVLEAMFLTTIGIVFAITGESDPDHAKAIGILDYVKAHTKMRLNETGDAVVIRSGEDYVDLLLSELSQGLHPLRPNKE